jgi:hypothetical protein
MQLGQFFRSKYGLQTARNLSVKNCKGAVFAEAALILPLFFLLLFFIWEVSRFLTVYSLINKGAHEAINVATKIQGLNLEPSSESNNEHIAEARNTVISLAKNRVIESGFIDDDSLSVSVIRPGEVNHPRYNDEQKSESETYGELMSRYPIVIEIAAEVPAMIPTFGSLRIMARAAGFREM